MVTRTSKTIIFRAPIDFIAEVDRLGNANFMDRTDYILAACVKLLEFYESYGLMRKDVGLDSLLDADKDGDEQLALPAFLYSDDLDDDDDYALEAAEDDEMPWGY